MRSCPKCGKPRDPYDFFCTGCGLALRVNLPSSTGSTAQQSPLWEFPFLRQRKDETSHATEYTDVTVDRFFPRRYTRHFAEYEYSKQLRYKAALMLVTNHRMIFLENPGRLLSVKIVCIDQARREALAREQNRISRHGPPTAVERYLAPYWVFDPSLNDELDKEFKDSGYVQFHDFPYENDEASAEWNWVCSQPKKSEKCANCLEFDLGRVVAAPRQISAAASVPEGASRFAKGIANFVDRVSEKPISVSEPEGSAHLYMKNPADAEDLNSFLTEYPFWSSQSAFTPEYGSTLVIEQPWGASGPLPPTAEHPIESSPGAFTPGYQSAPVVEQPRGPRGPLPPTSAAKYWLVWVGLVAMCLVAFAIPGVGFLAVIAILVVLAMWQRRYLKSWMDRYGVRVYEPKGLPLQYQAPWVAFGKVVSFGFLVLIVVGVLGATGSVTQEFFPEIGLFGGTIGALIVAIAIWLVFRKLRTFRRMMVTACVMVALYVLYAGAIHLLFPLLRH
jgi:hypothetical protein